MKLAYILIPVLAIAVLGGGKSEALTMNKLVKNGDFSGYRIYFIGDSLSVKVGPGAQLCKMLEESGAFVLRDALGGRSDSTFILGSKALKDKGLREDDIAKVVKDNGINLAIVMLGTNHDPKNPERKRYWREIIGGLRDVPVIEIGPPSFTSGHTWPIDKSAPTVAKVLDELFPTFIDSQPLTKDMISSQYRPDKIHFSKKAAAVFAGRLYEEIKSVLSI